MQIPEKLHINKNGDDTFKFTINEIIDYLEYQKSPPSSPDTPIENKQDFWEAIEIIKSIENLCNNNWKYEDRQAHISKEKQEALCQRLLSILSNSNK